MTEEGEAVSGVEGGPAEWRVGLDHQVKVGNQGTGHNTPTHTHTITWSLLHTHPHNYTEINTDAYNSSGSLLCTHKHTQSNGDLHRRARAI